MTSTRQGAHPAPATPSAARERILATADRLFYNEGIHAVGIHRVVDEAAVTRVTLYRHFPSKDALISAYLAGRAQSDRDHIQGLIEAHPENPRLVLTLLATSLTADHFGAVHRGCPFINAAAEFGAPHVTREQAAAIREWVTRQFEDLLRQIGHRTPAATAQQLMMLRTGAVMSAALDDFAEMDESFVIAWNQLIDAGRPDGPPLDAAKV